MLQGNIKVGISFATGRKSFQKVLKTHIFNFKESGLIENERISLNLLVAYDLSYQKTRSTDYTKIPADLSSQLDEKLFISYSTIRNEIDELVRLQLLTPDQIALVFGKGYAAKRNALLYFAIKNKYDYMIFFDDDEYPMAVTNTHKKAIWSGQHVLSTHLKYITRADITHGHHCGYVSPIPNVEFDENMSEDDFRIFIEAISNDIVKWDKIRALIEDGGVTYADTWILTDNDAVEVPEVNHAKFISGANLCLNLTEPARVFPFYNPPGARGEDTFLSTLLSERLVLKVPCYTFHDGFSTYQHLLDGVLPIKLNFIKADNDYVISRFYRACLGWIRYKPLLLYITQRDKYDLKIREISDQLEATLPKISAHFNHHEFINILTELKKYHRLVRQHHQDFLDTQAAWMKIMNHLANNR